MLRYLRYLGIGALGLLCLAAICGGALFLYIHGFDPPANWQNPPLYPSAQQVKVQDYGERGEYQANGVFLSKVISFTVNDPPQKVRTFYQQAFGDGWRLDTFGNRPVPTPEPGSERLSLYTSNSRQRSPTIYYVDVITDPSPSGGTDLEIRTSFSPGY